MKKRVLATLAACALSAACIFGATACNNGDDGDKGNVPDIGNESDVPGAYDSIQVADEAAWNAAFNAPLSCTKIMSYKSSTDGGTFTLIASSTEYIVNNEDYIISTSVENGIESVLYEYFIYEGTEFYRARRDGADGIWEVNYGTVGIDINCYPYSAFTFENGKYVGSVTSEYFGNMETTITIKIGMEGYVNYIKEEQNDNEIIMTGEVSINNINSTTYTFPEDAKKAIANFRAGKN